jgi:Tfp pilus assembly protein PilN
MSGNSTFLPEEYVSRKKQAVTNVICLALFAVVMFGTFVAFLVTTRRSADVEQQKQVIDARYADAAVQIEGLRQLQDQKRLMLERAELAAALVERVPRSILLAELINRMPAEVSLIEFEIDSEKIKQIIRTEAADSPKDKANKGRLAPARGATRSEAAAAGAIKVQAPRYLVDISLVGVAPTDRNVARFLADLNAYSLFRDVTLDYSEETTLDNVVLREFRIRMKLDPQADIRDVEPLVKPRDLGNSNPMERRGIFAPALGGGDS